ncbi:hypothetical protein OG21DRAFT_1279067 [Imleria badia]|nr:hypothetical protein OG21DRAFT_1279067 [Imleria badia]
MSYPEASHAAVLADTQDNDLFVQPLLRKFRGDEKGKGQTKKDMEKNVAATDTPKLSAPQGDDSVTSLAASEAGVTHLIDTPLQGTGDEVADYVDNVGGGSAANPLNQPSRKRSAGLSVHPRNRTLSASVQAYLSQPRHPHKKPPTVLGDEQPTRTSNAGTMDTHPRLLLRLTDGPTRPTLGKCPSPRQTTVERTADGESFTPDDTAFGQHHGRPIQSCVFSSNRASAKHTDSIFQRGDHAADGAMRSRCADGEASANEAFSPGNGRSGLGSGFLPGSGVAPSTKSMEGSLVEGRLGLVEINDALDVRSGGLTSSVLLDDHAGDHPHGGTSPAAAGSSVFHRGERAGYEAVGAHASPSRDDATSGPNKSTETKTASMTDVSALETRLRARARVRVRLAAIKGVVESSVGSSSG